jgi:hypothetical protein
LQQNHNDHLVEVTGLLCSLHRSEVVALKDVTLQCCVTKEKIFVKPKVDSILWLLMLWSNIDDVLKRAQVGHGRSHDGAPKCTPGGPNQASDCGNTDGST